MKVARRSPGVVCYRGVVYVVGGMGTKKDLKSMEMLCPVTKKWITLPNGLNVLSGNWVSKKVANNLFYMVPLSPINFFWSQSCQNESISHET